MATHPIIHHATTGQTVQAKFYNSSDSLVTTQSLTETPASSGRYVLTAATLSALPLAEADYDVRIEVGGNLARAQLLRWGGSTESLEPVNVTEIGGTGVTSFTIVASGNVAIVEQTTSSITTLDG